jgi:hypothetical protein
MNPEIKILLLFGLAGLFALRHASHRPGGACADSSRNTAVSCSYAASPERRPPHRAPPRRDPQVDVDESAVSVTDFYSAFEPAIKLSPATYEGKRLFNMAPGPRASRGTRSSTATASSADSPRGIRS